MRFIFYEYVYIFYRWFNKVRVWTSSWHSYINWIHLIDFFSFWFFFFFKHKHKMEKCRCMRYFVHNCKKIQKKKPPIGSKFLWTTFKKGKIYCIYNIFKNSWNAHKQIYILSSHQSNILTTFSSMSLYSLINCLLCYTRKNTYPKLSLKIYFRI